MSPPKFPMRPHIDDAETSLLTELIQDLRDDRSRLCQEWLQKLSRARLLAATMAEDLTMEATGVYNQYVIALRTGSSEALQMTARNLLERAMTRRARTGEVIGIVLLLRDVLARALVARHQFDIPQLQRFLDAYESAANRITIALAVGFVGERERMIREQQDKLRDLAMPVLQVREHLLVLPMIGAVDPGRIRHVTERLLHEIRSARAKVIVIDLTGVAPVDPNIAHNLVQAIDASRLLGAKVIVSGLASALERRLLDDGVDLEKKMLLADDLHHGVALAEQLLGYPAGADAGGDKPGAPGT